MIWLPCRVSTTSGEDQPKGEQQERILVRKTVGVEAATHRSRSLFVDVGCKARCNLLMVAVEAKPQWAQNVKAALTPILDPQARGFGLFMLGVKTAGTSVRLARYCLGIGRFEGEIRGMSSATAYMIIASTNAATSGGAPPFSARLSG